MKGSLYMTEPMIQLNRYLDDAGRIKQMPRRQAPRYALLAYLAEKFEPGVHYTEPQVNAICEEWHTFGDFFLLRRELVDYHFLCRERDGSRYWRSPEQAPVPPIDQP